MTNEGETLYPLTYEGRTYLPVRSLAEALHVPIQYEATSNTVSIGEKTDKDPILSESYRPVFSRITDKEPASTPWSQKYYDFALDYNYPVKPDQRNQTITRAAVAGLIAATQGEHLTGDLAIQYLLDHRLSSGVTSATIEGYKGESYLTRAEAVRFIRNVIRYAEYQTPQRLR